MWVKAHDSLTKGFWSGVPRAYRFVLLELSILCRPGRGMVSIPPGKDPITRTVDMLGGNRREARKAVVYLSSTCPPTVVYRSPDGALIDPCLSSVGPLSVVIPSWGEHNAVTKSARRMRKFRQKQPLAEKSDASLRKPCDVTCDAPEERREEKKREEPTASAARAREAPPTPHRETSSPEAEALCVECGRPVEAPRRCYAQPTCYACLPPPEPLPVIPVPDSIRETSSPQAEAILAALRSHKHLVAVAKPTYAEHLAGKLGLAGNNRLTVARVELALAAVADKTAALEATEGPRSQGEITSHISNWVRQPDHWWRDVEQREREAKPAPPAAKPKPPEPPPTAEERAANREAARAAAAAFAKIGMGPVQRDVQTVKAPDGTCGACAAVGEPSGHSTGDCPYQQARETG